MASAGVSHRVSIQAQAPGLAAPLLHLYTESLKGRLPSTTKFIGVFIPVQCPDSGDMDIRRSGISVCWPHWW